MEPTTEQPKFYDELLRTLYSMQAWEIQHMPAGTSADIMVSDKETGRKTIIEIKDAKSYGELPISSLIPLFNLSQKIMTDNIAAKIILVSLSKIPSIVKQRLEDIDIKPMQQPTVEDVVAEIGQALAPAS